jgi:putative flippase GtrA
MKPFIRYLIIGFINTLIGYSVYIVLISVDIVTPQIANGICYIVAIIFAFILNKVFLFSYARMSISTIKRFLLAFILSFIINQIVLFVLHNIYLLSAEIAQIFSMATYTVIFYKLNKYYVYR